MIATTLKRLLKSIAHWKRMASGKAKTGEEPVGGQCALCERFAVRTNAYSCEGCPVREMTGLPSCRGTPYLAAYNAYCSFGIDSKQFRQEASAELAFLKSLLPKASKR